ncbi:hypothetical protein NQZ79_g8862 [Umbelopsis isabellina]|nr:hypothetical protein NQZ79_g8862 [Umbelopsis isabellina]
MSIELNPPNQLTFRRPLTRTVTENLELHNPHSNAAVFKIKTTAPKAYCVRPNSGRIDPGATVSVQVLLQPMAQEPPEDHKCKDKFLVQSTLLPPSLANMPPADVMSEISSADPTQIHQAKLKCVYATAQNEVPEAVGQSQAENIPVEKKSSDENLAEPRSLKDNSEEDEAYENARRQVEQIVPEPWVSSTSSNTEHDTEKEAEKEVPQAPVEAEPVKSPPQAAKEVPVAQPEPTVEDAAVPVAAAVAEEGGRHSEENKKLRSNLQTANESILALQKTIDQLKRELSAAQASTLTQRKTESSASTTSPSSRKLPSTVKPEDAVHQHLASLQVASPTEGYPPQVVAIIAFVVFVFTWLFF